MSAAPAAAAINLGDPALFAKILRADASSTATDVDYQALDSWLGEVDAAAAPTPRRAAAGRAAFAAPAGVTLPFVITSESQQSVLSRIVRPPIPAHSALAHAHPVVAAARQSLGFDIDYAALDAWMEEVETELETEAKKLGIQINKEAAASNHRQSMQV